MLKTKALQLDSVDESLFSLGHHKSSVFVMKTWNQDWDD